MGTPGLKTFGRSERTAEKRLSNASLFRHFDGEFGRSCGTSGCLCDLHQFPAASFPGTSIGGAPLNGENFPSLHEGLGDRHGEASLDGASGGSGRGTGDRRLGGAGACTGFPRRDPQLHDHRFGG